MLASKFNGEISQDDILELLDGLKNTVYHSDKWTEWNIDEDEWTDGKVYACLEKIIQIIEEQPQ